MTSTALLVRTTASGVAGTPTLRTTAQWYPHDMMEGMWGWGVGIFGILFWLALLVLVVVLIWRLVEGAGGLRSDAGGGEDPPLEILKRRYARGEIDRDEYLRMKEEIGG